MLLLLLNSRLKIFLFFFAVAANAGAVPRYFQIQMYFFHNLFISDFFIFDLFFFGFSDSPSLRQFKTCL